MQTRLRLGQFDEAVKAASDYKDIFGEGRYFLELMDHGIEIERRVRDGLLEIGRKLDIPPLVKNDSHYTYAYANEATAHEALLCIRPRTEAPAQDLGGPPHQKRDLMPKFDIPEGFTEVTWFQEEVRVGMGRRYPAGVPEDRQKQAEYEMDIIIQMGFPGYFLVVADFIMDQGEAVKRLRSQVKGPTYTSSRSFTCNTIRPLASMYVPKFSGCRSPRSRPCSCARPCRGRVCCSRSNPRRYPAVPVVCHLGDVKSCEPERTKREPQHGRCSWRGWPSLRISLTFRVLLMPHPCNRKENHDALRSYLTGLTPAPRRL